MRRTKWCQEGIYLLIALALLAGIPFMPRAAASPDQATFYSSAYDGYLEAINSSYSAVHGASSGDIFGSSMVLSVGQVLVPPEYQIYEISRAALFFDTSSLPDGAIITSATSSLFGYQDYSDTDFKITVVDASGINESLKSSDYGYLVSQTLSGGAFDTSGFSIFDYNDIPLNERGMGWISKTGITKFGVRSSRDISATEPFQAETVAIRARNYWGSEYWPKLVVTYTTPQVPVGGEAYPVNKTSLLAPWIAVGVLLAGGISFYVLRRRRVQS